MTMTRQQPSAIRVTATDPENGDSQTVEITDDYVITTSGSCYVDHVQAYANGTHVVTIKGRRQA